MGNNYVLSTACTALWQDIVWWKGIIRVLMGEFYESVVGLQLLMSDYEVGCSMSEVGLLVQALQHMA